MNQTLREIVRGIASIGVASVTLVSVPSFWCALPLAILAVVGYQTLFDRLWTTEKE